MNIATSHPQALSFARFLADIAECKQYVYELKGEPEGEDARDVCTLLRKVGNAYANLVERHTRNLQRFADVELTRYPLADLTPAACREAIMDTFNEVIRPGLVKLEECLLDMSEHDRDPFAEHRLGAQALGVGGRR